MDICNYSVRKNGDTAFNIYETFLVDVTFLGLLY